ncbi:hypothetical protein [Afifella sp. IM 167]|uniref:hypothetical protein n=1 Tax=Afifella sp. IM 167 TaxID=2033586 RepID=UPI001CCF0C27|nr:hypothetical protein [Afifella sp. IM 167]MBZ8134883.1 hypothetical protein [Afifella sp. IM 167]
MRSLLPAILAAFLALTLAACTPGLKPAGSGTGATRMVAGETKIAFAPLTGPPQQVADRLAVIVARDAAARGMNLADFRERGSSYTLKGYLSAVDDDGGTLLVYVWDVLSPDLKRLNRISGKIKVGASASDAWSVVDDAALASLSSETLDKLAAWLSSG